MTTEPSRSKTLRTRIRHAIDARLSPAYLRLVSVTVLVVAGVMACVSFATSERGRTIFGPPLGVDFAGFYVAAQILDRGETTRLYERELHDQLYHELLPNLPAGASIPYVHPPFVAEALRPLARLPYEVAVAIWLAISASLFGSGVWLLIRSLPGVARQQRGLILILSLSFEPFLLECWLGGQLSAVGFFSYALAWFALSRHRATAAGIALGLSFYKPTLLLLALPMLLIGRRWRILLGLAITGVSLALLSLFCVGWHTSVEYLDVLSRFRNIASGGDVGFRTWKYVDLNNAMRLLCGAKSPVALIAFVVFSAVPLAWLAKAWWRWPRMEFKQRQWLWAATLAWLPILNLYVGIYDSIFIVQSVLLAADLLWRERRSETPLRSSGLAYFALLVAGTAWFSQPLAVVSGVQVYTLALIGLGVFELRQVTLTRTSSAS